MSLMVSSAAPAVEADAPLIEPVTVIVDRSLPKKVVEKEIQAARRYATFWSSGKESLARTALSPDFMDRTLPDGRQQGIAGPIAASATVHAAIPDIRCEIEQLIVARDRVVVHLHFSGHYWRVQGYARARTIDSFHRDRYLSNRRRAYCRELAFGRQPRIL